MRRHARASHLTRRPIHSSLLLQIEDSRSGPRAWSRHLQLAYAILSLELAVPEENSRVILISALQAAHDCAKRIDQLAGDGVQLQIRRDVCERLGRVAKCAKRAPAELRRRLDRAIAPLMRENHIDLEVIEAVFDIAVEIFSAYPRHEPAQTALAALTDQLGGSERYPKIKIDFSALNARDRIKAEKNVAALGQACSASDVFAALSAALQDDGTAKVSVQIHPLIVDYVAEVGEAWQRYGLKPSRAGNADNLSYRSKFHRFVDLVLTEMVEPWARRHEFDGEDLEDFYRRVRLAHKSLPNEYRVIASSAIRRADVEWLVSADHIDKALSRIQKTGTDTA